MMISGSTAEPVVVPIQDGPAAEARVMLDDKEESYRPLLARSDDHTGHALDDCGFCLTALKAGDNGTLISKNFPNPYPDR